MTYGPSVHSKMQGRTLFSSAARTTLQNSEDIPNEGFRGLTLVIDATAGTPTGVTFTIKGKDPVSGKYYTILASAAITGAGTTVLRIYPGMTAAANLAASAPLPPIWRLEITVADAGSLTYSVGFCYHT